MSRGRVSSEEVSAKEAAKRLGMTDANVGQWGSRTGAPTRVARGRRVYRWPEFPIWYREQLQKSSTPADLDEAKVRKLGAEAEIAELELAKARGELLTREDVRRVVGEAFTRVRGRLVALPGRLAPEVVGVRDIAAAVPRIEAAVREVMEELSTQW